MKYPTIEHPYVNCRMLQRQWKSTYVHEHKTSLEYYLKKTIM